jgi:methyltransferase family protein
MSDSLADWLTRREAADAAARSISLTQAIVERLPRDRTIRIVDLGTGTGSNVRYLAPRLPRDQQWLVVDRDAVLLAELRRRMPSLEIETRHANLGQLDPELFGGRDLVTASALLDLVSASWIEQVARRCRAAGASALFALTYDGRSQCEPVEPEDELVRSLMNAHQRANDKGFGRAAGPDAVAVAARAFTAEGFDVRHEASDWVLTPDMTELQRPLIKGWAEAALEIAPDRSPAIRDWLGRRLAHVAARRSRIVVGHQDLAALL